MTTRPGWTFITNHGLVLSYISGNPISTAREIAGHIGVTERTTHKIIADLEIGGCIERRKNGRRNVYRVDDSRPLRHPTIRTATVSDLLGAIKKAVHPSTTAPIRSRPLPPPPPDQRGLR